MMGVAFRMREMAVWETACKAAVRDLPRDWGWDWVEWVEWIGGDEESGEVVVGPWLVEEERVSGECGGCTG